MMSVNAFYAVNGDVQSLYSSTRWVDNVVGQNVSGLVKAMLEEQPIDDPHATFRAFRRLVKLRNSATNECEWSTCDIDDMPSPHCDYRVDFEVQPAEKHDRAYFAAFDVADQSSVNDKPLDYDWSGYFRSPSPFRGPVTTEAQLDPEDYNISFDRFTEEDSFCYDSDDDGDSESALSFVSDTASRQVAPVYVLHGSSLPEIDGGMHLGDLDSWTPFTPGVVRKDIPDLESNTPGSKPHQTFEATSPINNTDGSSVAGDRALSLAFAGDDGAAAADETDAVRRKTPKPDDDRPKETDRRCRLEREFDGIYELAAKSTAIIDGEARFWDGVLWAFSVSTETTLSAENRRCLRNYVETLEKMEEKYKAARLVVEDVINKLTLKA